MGQSRVENILETLIEGGDISALPPSQSRNEVLLKLLGGKIDEKLDGNFGADNAGKVLGIGQDGTVAPAAAWGSGVVITEAVVSGDDYELSIAEEE